MSNLDKNPFEMVSLAESETLGQVVVTGFSQAQAWVLYELLVGVRPNFENASDLGVSDCLVARLLGGLRLGVLHGVENPDSVRTLGLSVRTLNQLLASEIVTIGQLCQRSQFDLLKLPNVGKRSVTEIMDALRRRGLVLRGVI